MNKSLLLGLGVVIVVIAAVGGWWLWSQNNTAQPVTQNYPSNQTGTVSNPDQSNPIDVGITATTGKTYVVTYTDAGYSPSSLTIKAGDTVTWKNQSSSYDWVASANHPSHTLYSGTSLQQHCPDTTNTAFDECTTDSPGDSWSFTFTKAGTWGYHNHARASQYGTIIVQ